MNISAIALPAPQTFRAVTVSAGLAAAALTAAVPALATVTLLPALLALATTVAAGLQSK